MILFVFCCVLSSSLILLILSLTLLGLGSKCTSLSPEDRWGRSMWLVSCRRQGMLTQGCASDLKCKLNNSSFLTLLYPLDCLITANDAGWKGWGVVHLCWGLGGWTEREVIFFYLLLFFVLFLIILSWLVHASCSVCFFIQFLLSLTLIPLISHY